MSLDKDHVVILGVKVATLKKTEMGERIKRYLSEPKFHYIVTPNPEFILAAEHDEEFFHCLNNADLALPDGFGLVLAGWLLGHSIHRYSGADLTSDLLSDAAKNNRRVGILVWNGGLSRAEEIRHALTNKFPALRFIVDEIEKNILSRPNQDILDFKPELVFVGLGAPEQEKYIHHRVRQWPSVKLAVGVGGTFDFITGHLKRAPKFFRCLGFEWLWRLILQPWRWRRIFNAAVIFPYKFFFWRFILPFLYRPNVVCLVFKKTSAKYQVLLVKRSDLANHWQMPQGGIDGQELAKAGLRELSEELNTDKFRPIAAIPRLFKYDFPPQADETEGLSFYQNACYPRHAGYRGQKQGLFIAEFLGEDHDIKLNYWDHEEWKWVDSEKFADEVYISRKESAQIFLDKFNEIIKKYEASF
jgi:N-acetylglucosaminyldiphosphoundecaprenol N-acetyl-beta-D-mannosaminyltransferase